MVSTSTLTSSDEEPLELNRPAPPPRPRRSRAGVVSCALVVVLSLLPVLRDRWAYYTDDSVTQILPLWHHLGMMVRNGQWPPLFTADSWMGGNLALEALFGVWNPVNAGIWVFVSFFDNLAIAATLVRIAAFVLIAAGCYLLCREYGAAPWASGAVATAMPFAGSLFYYDAIKWPAALFAYAWIPFTWLLARRMARNAANPLWVFLLGALAVTAGNPYTMLALCVVLTAVLVEQLLQRNWVPAAWVFGTSATIAALVPLVYFPLMASSHVTWRKPEGVQNSGAMAPSLSDLLNLSVPSFVPEIPEVMDPAVYFCWFALPLLPWLRWNALGTRWRAVSGCFVVGVFVLLALGPAELWMFRWPLRVLHYGFLALAVLLALLLTAGFHTDRLRQRAGGTAALIGLSLYLSWSAKPNTELLDRHAAVAVLLGGGAALALWAWRTRGPIATAAVLQIGTILGFGMQVIWFIEPNEKIYANYQQSVSESHRTFAQRYPSPVLQVVNLDAATYPPGYPPSRDFAVGNLPLVSGFSSINSYTGMGMMGFTDQLCMGYVGQTCPDIYRNLWTTPRDIPVPYADLLQLNTVVVQRSMIEAPHIPAGWQVAERTPQATVLTRITPLPSAERAPEAGRLTWATPGLRIEESSAAGERGEQVTVDRTAPGTARIVFNRLAWPGFMARLGDREWPAEAGPAGLLEVRLPPEVDRGQLEVTWQPPGLNLGLACAGMAIIAAAVLSGFHTRRKHPEPRA